MTFNERVNRRWRVATACAISGFLVMLMLTVAILFFTVFVAIPLEDSGLKIVLAVVLFLVASAFGIGWGFRSAYVESIDVMIRNMGPLQKKMLLAAIQEELKPGKDPA
jgi:hypothetical protein